MTVLQKPFTISKVFKVIIALLIITPLIFLLIKSQAKATWWSNDWDYRKPVTITYSGTSLANYDVIIEVGTSSLIAEGKMQADCDDIRLVDSDDSTTIDYWIEGGCNTSDTQIWTKVPDIPDGGKDIYLYYNNVGATNAEESWSSNFMFLYDDAESNNCPTGWTRESSYDSKFPRGAATQGGTGGTTTHNHGTATCTSGGSSTWWNIQYGSTEVARTYYQTHTHALRNSTGNTSAWPPYRNMLYCRNTDLDIPAGLITIFDTSTPTNWTRFSALDSKWPRGSSTYGGTGGTSNHTHSLGAMSSGGASGSTLRGRKDGGGGAYIHTHTSFAGTSGGKTATPPYKNVVYAETDNDTKGIAGMIVMYKTALPPLGWTRFTTLDNYFPRGNSSYSATAYAAHTHSAAIASRDNTSGYAYANTSGIPEVAVPRATHRHYNCTDSATPVATQLPPYVNTIFGQRNDPAATTSVGAEKSRNNPPSTPTLDSPTDTDTNQHLFPSLQTGTTDPESDYLRYKIELCENVGMSTNCRDPYDQTLSQTGWSGQDAEEEEEEYTAYASGTQATYTLQATLAANFTYYWRSYATDPAGSTDWSETQGTPYSFTTSNAPTAPTIPYTEGETNPIDVIDRTPEFSAIHNDPETDPAIYYEIEVNTASNFSGTVMWDSGQVSMSSLPDNSRCPDVSYAGSTLILDGTIYYWRIRFTDDKEAVGAWSDTQNFTMNLNAAPSAPTIPYTEGQTNPSGLLETTPEFSAIHNDSDGDAATYYEIEVNTTSDFSGTVMWDSNKTSMTSTPDGNRCPDASYAGTAIPIDGLGTIYYWRIRFTDYKDDTGAWSDTQNFTMNIKPNTPDLDSPTDDETEVIHLTPFKTTADDNDNDYLRYKIDLCENEAMNNCVIGSPFIQPSGLPQTGWTGQDAQTDTAYASGTQATYTLQTALATSSTYYWRSYTIDHGGSNVWSNTQSPPFSFTTDVGPGAATACVAKESIDDTQITVQWIDNADNENFYEIQRSVNSTSYAFLQTVVADSTSYPDSTISQSNTYQYRIAPYISAGPYYASWCYTPLLDIQQGNFSIEGLKLEGVKLN